jgi:hypothetical protein
VWPLEHSSQSRTLVADSEAFLLGDLAEEMDGRQGRVPVWTWTNLLAHGSEDDLHAVGQGPRVRLSASADRWRAARSYLVEEVFDLAERYGPLTELQHKVLVPLELELASSAEVDWWGPGQWVNAVRARLAEYRLLREREELRARSWLARGMSSPVVGRSSHL